jgi:lipoprotein LprG
VRKVLVGIVAAICCLAVTACTGGSSTTRQSPAERLARAKAHFDHARFIGFDMHTDSLPSGTNGLISANGTGTHAPAFAGDVEVKAPITLKAPLVAVGGRVFAKLPFVGWSQLHPSDYGAPDPAQLMSSRRGVSTLFTATRHPRKDGSQRSGKLVLTTITGTLPGDRVRALFPSAGSGDYPVVYALSDADDVHSVKITGPFYGSAGDVTYTIDLNLHAKPVRIKAPTQ